MSVECILRFFCLQPLLCKLLFPVNVNSRVPVSTPNSPAILPDVGGEFGACFFYQSLSSYGPEILKDVSVCPASILRVACNFPQSVKLYSGRHILHSSSENSPMSPSYNVNPIRQR
ncbi:hypothetical protein NPIL_208151 [Nephila pilipes]|uniref:Secreted protein n=1 Tax=Nephila pilipes TaxID=299642 RepID=A0A8X6Q7R6_NEPPI|nr:hypothetical protein NPIL_208151 [Nephila pilipes]